MRTANGLPGLVKSKPRTGKKHFNEGTLRSLLGVAPKAVPREATCKSTCYHRYSVSVGCLGHAAFELENMCNQVAEVLGMESPCKEELESDGSKLNAGSHHHAVHEGAIFEGDHAISGGCGEMAKVDCNRHSCRLVDDHGCDAASASPGEDDDFGNRPEHYMEGTFERSPPRGTRVKVLFDDQIWWPGKITFANASKALIEYENGSTGILDFEFDCVRHIDYDSDEERVHGDARPGTCNAAPHGGTDTVFGSGYEAKLNRNSVMECDRVEEDGNIAGTLNRSPPDGTKVKTLLPDGTWLAAYVVKGHRSVVKLLYEDGTTVTLDLKLYAVRLFNYCNQEKEDCDTLMSMHQIRRLWFGMPSIAELDE